MATVVISGDTSGAITLQAPAVAGTTTLNLPTVSGGILVTSDSSGNVGMSIEEIAAKDVPAGKEYKIVDVSEIPEDRTFRNAWEWSE